jgi:hypothetical protein
MFVLTSGFVVIRIEKSEGSWAGRARDLEREDRGPYLFD